ncbi:hypothetical protein E2C01_046366 [Portunus trituberculatus]|uniref:Uncharacterized protein n=1 Tax=Portunus trituberculatus TaxID=210409 RepID=A0A5B7G4L3_PORTR|nr:hypothetical protein [Portunus trituberculatus]
MAKWGQRDDEASLKDSKASQESTIPSLLQEDGGKAYSALDKANILATNFTGKMYILDMERTPSIQPDIVSEKLMLVKTCKSEVKYILIKVDKKKAVGSNKINLCQLC